MNPSQILPKQNNIAFRIKQRFLRSWLSSPSPLWRRLGRPRLADLPNGLEGRDRQQASSPWCPLTRQGQSGHLCFASRLLQLSRYAPYQRTWKAFSHDAQRVRFSSVTRRVPGYPFPHEPERQEKPSPLRGCPPLPSPPHRSQGRRQISEEIQRFLYLTFAWFLLGGCNKWCYWRYRTLVSNVKEKQKYFWWSIFLKNVVPL